MAGITVTPSYCYLTQTLQGVPLRQAKLAIAGLAAGANVVPHGLPAGPISVLYDPGAAGLWGETQPADTVNLYITVGAGGATAGTAYVQY
ncbi:MAG TPA: hypothetical protein VG860_15875 [Terriglobia bacterium]|jgi:hypothetical protein|nr:hypothetical protein [Terriglobia bacterium]